MHIGTLTGIEEALFGPETQVSQRLHTGVALVYHSHIYRGIPLLIRLIYIRTCLVELLQHLWHIVIGCPMDQLFLRRVYLARPIGDVGTLNSPAIHFSFVYGSLLPEQINVLAFAIHACDIEGSVAHIGGPVENWVSIFESAQVEREVGGVVRAHMY